MTREALPVSLPLSVDQTKGPHFPSGEWMDYLQRGFVEARREVDFTPLWDVVSGASPGESWQIALLAYVTNTLRWEVYTRQQCFVTPARDKYMPVAWFDSLVEDLASGGVVSLSEMCTQALYMAWTPAQVGIV